MSRILVNRLFTENIAFCSLFVSFVLVRLFARESDYAGTIIADRRRCQNRA